MKTARQEKSRTQVLQKNPLGRVIEKLEKTKASVRAKVEHCFHVVKCLFKHRRRATAA